MESRPTASQPGVFALSGSLDAHTRGRVSAVLRAALAYASARRLPEIVVDMRAVRFLDAGAIRLLLQARQTALEAGRTLRLTGADSTVRRVVEAGGAGRWLLDHDPEPAPRETVPAGGEREDWLRASSERRRAEDDQARLRRRLHQQIVDGEVRATQRFLLAELRARLRADPRALTGAEFLAGADRAAVAGGILTAATIVGGADACQLQFYDERTGTLRDAGRRGLPSEFRPHRSPVTATIRPIGVDDIAGSSIFSGHPGVEAMVAAGLPALRSYPLRDEVQQLLGVLSMHFRGAVTRPDDADLVAEDASFVLARLPEAV